MHIQRKKRDMQLLLINLRNCITNIETIFSIGLIIVICLTIVFSLIKSTNTDESVQKSITLVKKYGLIIDDDFQKKYWEDQTKKTEYKNFQKLYFDYFGEDLVANNDDTAEEAVNRISDLFTESGNFVLNDMTVMKSFKELIESYRNDINKDITPSSEFTYVSNEILFENYSSVWKYSTICVLLFSVSLFCFDRKYDKSSIVFKTSFVGERETKISNISKFLISIIMLFLVFFGVTILYSKATGFDMFLQAPIRFFIANQKKLGIADISVYGYCVLLACHSAIVMLYVNSAIALLKYLFKNDDVGLCVSLVSVTFFIALSFLFFNLGYSFFLLFPLSTFAFTDSIMFINNGFECSWCFLNSVILLGLSLVNIIASSILPKQYFTINNLKDLIFKN